MLSSAHLLTALSTSLAIPRRTYPKKTSRHESPSSPSPPRGSSNQQCVAACCSVLQRIVVEGLNVRQIASVTYAHAKHSVRDEKSKGEKNAPHTHETDTGDFLVFRFLWNREAILFLKKRTTHTRHKRGDQTHIDHKINIFVHHKKTIIRSTCRSSDQRFG